MQKFPDPAGAPRGSHHPQHERTSLPWVTSSWNRVTQWGHLVLTRQTRNRVVDQRLQALEGFIDYSNCPNLLALAAQIAQWMQKPIEITPSPFPGELAALVVGTRSKYAIRYSMLAHPMLQLVAICHEFAHIILEDVEVSADQDGTVIKRRLCGPPDLDTIPDAEAPDPLREAQAERLGMLLRKHWELARPAQGPTIPLSMSPIPEDQQAWARYRRYYAPLD